MTTSARARSFAGGRVALCFVCGLYFALLQFAYFFLLEAYLSSQALSYFVTLLFWLCGFAGGLFLTGERWSWRLLVAGLAAYYATWGITKALPFHGVLYFVAALGSVVSGLLPGYFVPWMSKRMRPVSRIFFHENNGFLLGVLIALQAAILRGSWFLAAAPALGALAVALVLRYGNTDSAETAAATRGP